MQAIWAVYKREAKLYFQSFIAYGIAFALVGFIGLLFAGNVAFVQQSVAMGQGGSSATSLVGANMGVLTFLMFLIAPLLTMRLLSEESREGTLEVLMTLPMAEGAFVVGKFLAAWTFYTFLLALTLIHLVLLASMGPINTGTAVVMYLGAWLYGGAALAIGMIWSAVTEDQLVAAFLGAASLLGLYLAESFANIAADPRLAGVAEVLRELSLPAHYQSTMLEGLLRAEDVIYFVLLIVVALFITTLMVGTRRWRAS